MNLTDNTEGSIRLQAYLARCGVASRRSSELLISSGRVTVNGLLVTRLGTKVVPGDRITVDGRTVEPETTLHYLALHKPPEYLCSAKDAFGRRLAGELLPEAISERVYNIGRLDYQSSGLILYTNDGSFATAVSHPRAEIEKEYLVDSTVPIPDSLLEEFLIGIRIEEVLYKCRRIERLGRKTIQVVLVEGKNREIRKVFSYYHLHPRRLHRLRIGPVLLGSLMEGQSRPLTPVELQSLQGHSTGKKKENQ